MAAQHQQFAKLATKLINKHGRPLFLVKFTNSGSPSSPVRTEELMAVVGVQTRYKVTHGGDIAAANDKQFLIDAQIPITVDMRIREYSDLSAGLIPLGEWRAGIDAYGVAANERPIADYSIIETGLVKPGSTSIIYKVQARI